MYTFIGNACIAFGPLNLSLTKTSRCLFIFSEKGSGAFRTYLSFFFMHRYKMHHDTLDLSKFELYVGMGTNKKIQNKIPCRYQVPILFLILANKEWKVPIQQHDIWRDVKNQCYFWKVLSENRNTSDITQGNAISNLNFTFTIRGE